VTFVVGAIFSYITGYIGMSVAVRANVRTASTAYDHGLGPALRVSFLSGATMGFSVVGFGLAGLAGLFLIFRESEYLAGFGFGASSIALFARVGGGIFTKAADVGSDLVGKVEAGIPEDDPRNPGVIADNVGDNVGDVAGMGADLFESFTGSIIASVTLSDPTVLANFEFIETSTVDATVLPFLLAASGIVASFIGIFLVRTGKDTAKADPLVRQRILLRAIHGGINGASLLQIGFAAAIISQLHGLGRLQWNIFGAIVIGIVCGVTIGQWTEYCTSYDFAPTKSIANAGKTGPATVIIQGLSVGKLSCVWPVLAVSVTILVSLHLTGVYGVAIAAVGMLSTLGITLATDAYGPVADNAGGIAEMAGLPKEVRELTDALDALGNTTAATGKGFAIGSAVITAFALMTSYARATELTNLDVLNSKEILAGLLIGAAMPYIFAALTMMAVSASASDIIFEVRSQFRNIDGLKEGRRGVKPDSERCVRIATTAALREMILPGAIAVLLPILAGVIDTALLAGILIGSIVSGFILAVYMANAGGAWDNAKKYVENVLNKKNTDLHAAAVVGDTVGDPFKDTSGPALNILIKLMSVVSLLFADFFLSDRRWIGYIVIGVFTAILIVVVTFLQVRTSRQRAQRDREFEQEDIRLLTRKLQEGGSAWDRFKRQMKKSPVMEKFLAGELDKEVRSRGVDVDFDYSDSYAGGSDDGYSYDESSLGSGVDSDDFTGSESYSGDYTGDYSGTGDYTL
jgi:K(+)-stimulated pyrophosphate-energized sodium pump